MYFLNYFRRGNRNFPYQSKSYEVKKLSNSNERNQVIREINIFNLSDGVMIEEFLKLFLKIDDFAEYIPELENLLDKRIIYSTLASVKMGEGESPAKY